MAKILLVDDDSVLLKLYSTRLEVDKHQVHTTTNGQEGLKEVANFLPDIIVLDLLMPKLNGFEFLEIINKHPVYKRIKKVVFSSVANEEQINRLRAMGVVKFLNKLETTPTQLVLTINEMLTKP
jgi:CheY-like chemotaxis protein